MTHLEPSAMDHVLTCLDAAYEGSVAQDALLYPSGYKSAVTRCIDIARQRLRWEEDLSAPRLPGEELAA